MKIHTQTFAAILLSFSVLMACQTPDTPSIDNFDQAAFTQILQSRQPVEAGSLGLVTRNTNENYIHLFMENTDFTISQQMKLYYTAGPEAQLERAEITLQPTNLYQIETYEIQPEETELLNQWKTAIEGYQPSSGSGPSPEESKRLLELSKRLLSGETVRF